MSGAREGGIEGVRECGPFGVGVVEDVDGFEMDAMASGFAREAGSGSAPAY